MAGHTRVNLNEVEDQAPRFGISGIEARFARAPLVVVAGTARMKVDDEIIAFGAPATENKDAEMAPGWWAD